MGFIIEFAIQRTCVNSLHAQNNYALGSLQRFDDFKDK